MAGAEAVAAIQLIDACIGITKTILDISRAVKDAQGLPPKLRDLCEKLPAIEDLLETAHENFEDGRVAEENSRSVKPILQQCETALGDLRDIFRKACPKENEDRTKRVWRGARTVFFGRDGEVQRLLVSVQDNLRLLEQKEVFRIGDKLEELRRLTLTLEEDDGRITHTGSGNVLSNHGGTHTNYLMSGSGRQINNPGVYNEGPSTHTHNYHLTSSGSVQSYFLSVDASVAGLISLAGQLVPTLYQFGSAIREADKDAQAAAREVANMSIVLQGLQTYLVGRSHAKPQRLRLITVEHITASLTACVFTYSELNAILKSLKVESGLKPWDRAIWFMKKDSIQKLVSSLQSHKLTFTCMLNILQCDTTGEAERNMDRLCDQVDQLHNENKELSARLRNLEHHSRPKISARSVISITRNSIRHDHESSLARSRSSTASQRNSLDSKQSGLASLPTSEVAQVGYGGQPYRSAFEEQLHRSRVYRHAHANHSESSLTDDGRSTLALSICSSLTLGEVSNISVFAIPIFAAELSNASAYHFGTPKEVTEICPPTHLVPKDVNDKEPESRREVGQLKSTIPSWLRSFKRGNKRSQGPLDEQKTVTNPITVPAPGIFGVPLHTSFRRANVALSTINDEGQSYIYGYMPIIVASTGLFLKEKVTDAENIFATGSSPLQMQRLCRAFDSPTRYGKDLKWKDYTVHDGANLLLRFLLQLPESVIPEEFYERFRTQLRGQQAAALGRNNAQLSAVGTFVQDATIRAYQDLITELPPINRQLLVYLLDLLAVFASTSNLNKMTTARLAKIFQPAILSNPQHSSSVVEQQLSEEVIFFLIENEDRFI